MFLKTKKNTLKTLCPSFPPPKKKNVSTPFAFHLPIFQATVSPRYPPRGLEERWPPTQLRQTSVARPSRLGNHQDTNISIVSLVQHVQQTSVVVSLNPTKICSLIHRFCVDIMSVACVCCMFHSLCFLVISCNWSNGRCVLFCLFLCMCSGVWKSEKLSGWSIFAAKNHSKEITPLKP